MKRKLRLVFAIAVTIAISAGVVRGTEEQEETFGDKFKKLFVRPRRDRVAEKSLPTPTTKHRKKKKTSRARTVMPSVSPSASKTPTSSPAETPPSALTPSPSVSATPSLPPMIKPTASPVARKTGMLRATISMAEIADSQNYSPEVKKVIDLSLNLTTQNLGYKYASADPVNGGMDCSGFIYYVLSKCGVKDVPRDARQQYIWVRKAGNVQAVLAQRDDTFELDALTPGDLLFWATNYGVSRDPEITQTMIYLGRDKATNQRLMVGASETQIPKGRSRAGVGVFEFKIGRPAKGNKEAGPVFVGYGHIPGGQ